jgi:hypothetical protein
VLAELSAGETGNFSSLVEVERSNHVVSEIVFIGRNVRRLFVLGGSAAGPRTKPVTAE